MAASAGGLAFLPRGVSRTAAEAWRLGRRGAASAPTVRLQRHSLAHAIDVMPTQLTSGSVPSSDAGRRVAWAPVGQGMFPPGGLRGVASATGGGGGGVTETFDLLEQEEGLTRLDSYFPGGFIVNGINVRGAIVCLSHTWMMWSVGSFEEVTKESLAVLQLLRNPPEIIILGCGRQIRPLGSSLVAHLKKQQLRVETMDTPNAVATFNILAQEGRNVACALLPTA